MELSRIVQEIQYILAPAIMISSSSLLLLGFQNKFSALVNRFRLLNHERRTLELKNQLDAIEKERFDNIQGQLKGLIKRARYVKNAILMTYAAIAFFASTCIFLFINIYTPVRAFVPIIVCFLIGLIFVLFSSFLLMIETALAFRIVSIERES